MNTCIKCGKPIAEHELFCARCSLNPYDYTDTPSQPTSQTWMKAPVKQKPTPQTKPEQKQKTSFKAAFSVTLIALVLALACIGLLLYRDFSTRVQLRLREEAISRQENDYLQISQEAETLSQELEQTKAEIKAKDEQIATLQKNVNTAESEATQNEFNKNEELKQLQSELEEQTKNNSELQEKYGQLLISSASDQQAAEFMKSHVVFVENDGTGLFHRYGCDRFAGKTFWAYSRRLAESAGYSPCPHCIQ